MVGPVWGIKDGGNLWKKCLTFPVQDEFALTGLPELTASESMNSSPFGELQAEIHQRKGKETKGVYRLVEGTRMRVVEPKSWTFPKWPAQHNNTPHLGLMDAFNAYAVEYMCVWHIYIFVFINNRWNTKQSSCMCIHIVCWYVVWQHRVWQQVRVCVCVRVLKRAQTARRQQSALPVTAERRQMTERAREREICISLW